MAASAGRSAARSSPRTTLGLLAVLFVLLGAGILAGHLHHQPAPVTGSPATSRRLTISGAITSRTTAPGCASAPNVVRAGATVTVLDSNGAVLATTNLGPGQPATAGICEWRYVVTVPLTTGYQFQVAGVPPVGVTRQQLERTHGHLTQEDPVPNPGPANIDSGV